MVGSFKKKNPESYTFNLAGTFHFSADDNRAKPNDEMTPQEIKALVDDLNARAARFQDKSDAADVEFAGHQNAIRGHYIDRLGSRAGAASTAESDRDFVAEARMTHVVG